ncbi:hypothetical protein SAY86_003341 [Trapa natans]|uniref:Phosphoribosyltransferase domain-containing protein n=1 Tax=Trapa natans TaxID=22666 RepID=A0AAN7REV1_TRANT|nr:hypothetical protein SAY86_003341 [Trapa natans]
MDAHIERILWSEDQISSRVSELASEMAADFATAEPPPVFVAVATGAFLFVADLARRIPLEIAVDFVRADSYGSGTDSSGVPALSLDLKLNIQGRHVILVEDIVDTGSTLSCLIAHLQAKGASSVSVCAFLDKPVRRKVHFQLVGEGKFYRGFEQDEYHPAVILAEYMYSIWMLMIFQLSMPQIKAPIGVGEIRTDAKSMGISLQGNK